MKGDRALRHLTQEPHSRLASICDLAIMSCSPHETAAVCCRL